MNSLPPPYSSSTNLSIELNKHEPSKKEQYVDKSVPYLTTANRELVSLNGDAFFTLINKSDLQMEINCRHFSTYLAFATLNNKVGKFDWTIFNSVESIAENIPFSIEADYKALKADATRYELINNDSFGAHIKACFEDMQKSENETIRALLLESTSHTMMVRLMMKGTKENSLYVVNVYDPNTTNATFRCETKELPTFANYSLKQFIDLKCYEKYYVGVEPISLMMECNVASLAENVTIKPKILENFDPNSLTPTHMYFLLAENFTHDFFKLWDVQHQNIGQVSPKDLIDLLTGKKEDGTPALYMALSNGHVEIIKGLGGLLNELFQQLPDNEHNKLIDLIMAKDAGGIQGICKALMKGDTATINAYVELLRLIPKKELIHLLSLKTVHGIPMLWILLADGQTEAVKTYGKLLKQLFPINSNELVELLAAKHPDPDVQSGIWVAYGEDHKETMDAYGKLLVDLIPDCQGELIKALAWKKVNIATNLSDIENAEDVLEIHVQTLVEELYDIGYLS